MPGAWEILKEESKEAARETLALREAFHPFYPASGMLKTNSGRTDSFLANVFPKKLQNEHFLAPSRILPP